MESWKKSYIRKLFHYSALRTFKNVAWEYAFEASARCAGWAMEICNGFYALACRGSRLSHRVSALGSRIGSAQFIRTIL
jgi:hypothetical protein